MLHKTQGIVFRFTKYGETSIIVNIFTALFGLQSYIVNGVRSRGARQRIALFQPLTLVDLVVYHRENANLNRISEIKCLHPYQSIPVDIRKSTIAIFLNEVVNKTIKEESHARDLCSFMIQSFIAFDEQVMNTENFHLVFLIRLSRWLGFGAHHPNEILGPRVTDAKTETLLSKLLECDYDEPIEMTNEQRRELLDLVLYFYRDHVESMGELRSVQVLREVLN
jgi:DNA repair protein RecO (recombination protein O)